MFFAPNVAGFLWSLLTGALSLFAGVLLLWHPVAGVVSLTLLLIAFFIAEGVFQKFPGLKLVCSEAGFTWLPTLLWRANKEWRGIRAEVPWVKRPPADILRAHVRFTLQPVEAPDAATLARTLEHIGSDEVLLFSTDYPHWHFEGEDALPDGLPAETMRRMLVDNPLATYPRLAGATTLGGTGAVTEETMP